VSALGYGCGQLQAINLSGCEGVTDVCVSALGYGCDQLQTISLVVKASQTFVCQHWVMDVVSCRRSISIAVKASQTKPNHVTSEWLKDVRRQKYTIIGSKF
jgi:hypothetical protein